MKELKIKPFTKEYQTAGKELILKGMKERFGFIDHTLNPDLNDIYMNYSKCGNAFFIGFKENQLVCTGAFTREDEYTARIERMSVKEDFRRSGIAQLMLEHLEHHAEKEGYSKIVLETNQDWDSAINFYKKNRYIFDFQESERIHFMKKIG